MGRIPDLPCDIEQVVELLGIEVIRDTGTQLHCRCPFCADRKAHMNVKIRDNVFRCNRCGKGGGILHLYAEYGSIFDYADHAGRKGKTQQGTGQVPCGTSTKDSAEVALFHGTKVGAYRCSS